MLAAQNAALAVRVGELEAASAERVARLERASPVVQYLSTDAERLLLGACSCRPMALPRKATPSW